jgi:excisionase family DNA binding protein
MTYRSRWITTAAAAKMLGITQTRVLQLIYCKSLYAEKMGGIWLIPWGEVVIRREQRRKAAEKDSRYVSVN